jgi:hypothetical protein
MFTKSHRFHTNELCLLLIKHYYLDPSNEKLYPSLKPTTETVIPVEVPV